MILRLHTIFDGQITGIALFEKIDSEDEDQGNDKKMEEKSEEI